MDVSDAKLYTYLLRLGILAYQQEARVVAHEEEAPTAFDPLPKHTLKTMMAKFNSMAMAPSVESEDAHLRRSYLAFYAQLLSLKKNDNNSYEEFKQRVDLLIIKFITCSSKELSKSPEFNDRYVRTQAVNSQTIAFISLLISVAKQMSKTSPLIAQLERYQSSQKQRQSQGIENLSYEVKDMETVQLLKHVLSDIVLTDSMLQDDVKKNLNINPKYELTAYITGLRANVHPIYTRQDFDDTWESWKEHEIAATQKVVDNLKPNSSRTTDPLIIPPDPRAYFFKTLQYCLKADLNDPVLLSPKSKKLLNLCSTYWRIPQDTYAALILQTGQIIFNLDPTRIEYLKDCFNFVEYLADCALPSQWPRADTNIAIPALNELKSSVIQKISLVLRQILGEKPPKLGPYIELIEEHLIPWSGTGISERQMGTLKKVILSAAEEAYDKLLKTIPRDETLDLMHIADLGDSVIAVAKRLQKRYQFPLFNDLQIAKLVCSRQLRLFGIDFLPMFKYCIEGHQTRSEEPNFEEVIHLYQTVSSLKGLFDQVSISESFSFDVEQLFYPYILDWAKASSQLAKSWVLPAIEQDDFQPLDPTANIMYSTSVKDLFNSFSASLQVVQSVSWENQYHVAKVITLLIQGIGEAISLWVQRLRNSFIVDLSQVEARSANSVQSKWLDIARETIQGQHTNPPEPFHFRTETLVCLNDIDAAYDRLIKMEEMLDSDAIARRIEVEEKKRHQDKPTYLYAINIIRAQDLVPDESKGTRDAYVTLIDEMARKKIGRTRTVFDNLNPVWNQRFHLETITRSQNVKLMIWDENSNRNHGLCGTAFIKLDAKEFQHKEWGTSFKSAALERQQNGQPGQIDVQIIMDVEREDIRFYFGKALRFLHQTRSEMIELIVGKFSTFIDASISMNTLNLVLNRSKFNLSSWLPNAQRNQAPLSQEQVEDTLDPLFDYLNRNFATLASVLTDDLRIQVMTETWKVTLRKIESLILARLEKQKNLQPQLDSAQMDVLFTWLRALRDFFHHDGAGPSLESLQDRIYQKIMSIPVYYDMTTIQLRQECDKITKSSLKQFSTTFDLVSRQRTVMAHRNRKTIQSQEAEIRKAHMATLDIDKDDILLRILRMRKDDEFIDRQLEYRKRIEIRATTERALQGL